MHWERALFRAFVILAALFVSWATWTVLNGNQRQRNELSDECVRVWLTPPAEARLLPAAEAQAGYEDCIATGARAFPLWGEVVANVPRRFAVVMAAILAIPVVVWWLLRGLVALVAWIVRTHARSALRV